MSDYRWGKGQRARILGRDGGICWLCGAEGADSIDHVIPRAWGGSDDDTNLAAAHRRCNSARGGKTKGKRQGLPRAHRSRWG